jgi:hypothetical protein
MVGVMRRKKSISPAVIEKILCDNPRRFTFELCAKLLSLCHRTPLPGF